MLKPLKHPSTGFTLIECLVAVVLIGIAISSMMVANRSLSAVNGAGLDLSTAEFMIEQFKELSATLPAADPNTGCAVFGSEELLLSKYDDVDDFSGKIYSPPIDSSRQSMTDYTGWSQTIAVNNVSAADLRTPVASHSSNFYRVTVTVSAGGQEISSASWIRTR